MSMSTTTRRAALRGSFVGLIGITATATATAAWPTPAVSPDAALIAACDRLIAVQTEFDELFARRHSIEDEEQTEPELDALYDKRAAAEDGFDGFAAPKTLEGARAVARAQLAIGPKDNNEECIAEDFDEWLALLVIQFVADLDVDA